MRAPVVRVTATDTIKIGKLLEQHCHRDEATGLAIYDEDWNDLAIAKAVDVRLKDSNVASIRRALIGDLIRTRGNASISLDARITALEQQVAELQRRFPAAPQLSLVEPERSSR